MAIRYVAPFRSVLQDDSGKKITQLLWGDAVHPLREQGGRTECLARGRRGWVETADLGDDGVLELYVIDVGQGDSVLFRTPDDRWHVVDGGVANRSQMTRKGAANFIRWKFITDLRRDAVELETVILSHPDYDHYGGLVDLFRGRLEDGRTFQVRFARFFHNGIGRFARSPSLGATTRGSADPPPPIPGGVSARGTFITELLSGRSSFHAPPRPLSGSFADLAELVGASTATVRRISHRDRHLAGYGPGNASGVVIHVLGPVMERLGSRSFGLRSLSSQSKTRNGQSVVLRLDYGNARILLTGDLNAESQRLLLSYHDPDEFRVDVAKGCHHGSEDIDFDFVRAMASRATVISSGDNEDYSHPRPVVMGASARYGRESIEIGGEVLPPLVYSTELARSVKLDYAERTRVTPEGQAEVAVPPALVRVSPDVRGESFRTLDRTPLSLDLIYGLVNVRTDGVHILCATMEEKGTDFDIKIFRAG